MDDRVPNEQLAAAALELMKRSGKPLERIKTTGRSMIYRLADGKTVRLRTCNDHLLVVLADNTDPDTAKLNVEGTDYVLIVMPERQRSAGPVVAYLIPSEVVSKAARLSHKEWLSGRPDSSGNRTWNLWFGKDGPKAANGFAQKWQQYRIIGFAEAGSLSTTQSTLSPSTKLSDVIASAKRQIADASGVALERIKITIDI
jgi:hypothetical protein